MKIIKSLKYKLISLSASGALLLASAKPSFAAGGTYGHIPIDTSFGQDINVNAILVTGAILMFAMGLLIILNVKILKARTKN